MAFENKICPHCGIEFQQTHPCQKFCTKEHADKAALQMQREKRAEIKAKQAASKNWKEISRRCNELGISYGEAVVRGLV